MPNVDLAETWWLALVIGLVTSALTVTTGVLDWLTISWGSELWKTTTTHALAMVTATLFFVLAIILGHGGYAHGDVTRVIPRRTSASPSDRRCRRRAGLTDIDEQRYIHVCRYEGVE